jgi:hypothetical protein
MLEVCEGIADWLGVTRQLQASGQSGTGFGSQSLAIDLSILVGNQLTGIFDQAGCAAGQGTGAYSHNACYWNTVREGDLDIRRRETANPDQAPLQTGCI